MSKNSLAFQHMTQENFARFMDEATKLVVALEKTAPPLAAMIEELMQVAMRIRTLRQYCLNGSVAHGGKMMVDGERVIEILEGR